MGLCLSELPCFSDESSESRLITNKMTESEQVDKYTSKLLLLGTGNTGKTTFFRQFRLMAGISFSNSEREALRPPIENQVVQNMVKLCFECRRRIEKDSDSEMKCDFSPETMDRMERLIGIASNERATATLLLLDQTTYLLVKELWADPQIKKIFHDENDEAIRHLSIPETCAQFWDDIDRIGEITYVPTDEDLILLRSQTTGSLNFEYEQNGSRIMIIDVGGQRSERKKWLTVFDNITAVLYVVSLSAYDEYLYEDATVNSMTDQLNQFEATINRKEFWSIPIILFLNKKDLLENKIEAGRYITKYFSAFDGDETSVESSVNYIRKIFFSKNQNKTRRIYAHTTHAVDTRNVHRVLNDVTTMLVQRALASTGLTV